MDVHQERSQLESIRRGFAEMEAGHYIPHEAMNAWLLSLGSDHELPPPKCVCAESHDEPGKHRRW
jgi:predicted transcriptional regulator